MLRFALTVTALCLLTTVAAAEVSGRHRQVIDFTKPEQAAKSATWSDPEHLGCTKDGFGWDGDALTSRDGWIETEPLAIGTSWRPPRDAGIRIKVQTSYPVVVPTGPRSKAFYSPSIYVRYSADRLHWSDWQPTDLNEDPRAPGTVLYTTNVGVPRRARQNYDAKLQEWSRLDDIAWGSDEDEFCRWLVKHDPSFFTKVRPFVGYVQFLLESSFKGSQRLTQFEANVDWNVGGVQQIAKDPAAQKRHDRLNAWTFRGAETKTLRVEKGADEITAQAERFFAQADKDGNGEISKDEFNKTILVQMKLRKAGIVPDFPISRDDFGKLWFKATSTASAAPAVKSEADPK